MDDIIDQRYQISSKLGQGGFGAVYQATDLRLCREVAVKILSISGDDKDEMTARFLTEAQIASRLNHPNTLTVHDYGQSSDDRYYIISELLVGKSLHEYLSDEGKASIPIALEIAYQVSLALQEAHTNKIVHRDIKPANIYLNVSMSGPHFVKLLDFGIAKLTEGQSNTVTGQMMGTPHYMSPEQIVNIKQVDHRTDIYSLGIVFYHALMGKVPFDDESYYAIMRHHMQSKMPQLELNNTPEALNEHLKRLFNKMTVKDPRKRVSSTLEVLNAIQEIWATFPTLTRMNITGAHHAVTTTPAVPIKALNEQSSSAQKTSQEHNDLSLPSIPSGIQPNLSFNVDQSENEIPQTLAAEDLGQEWHHQFEEGLSQDELSLNSSQTPTTQNLLSSATGDILNYNQGSSNQNKEMANSSTPSAIDSEQTDLSSLTLIQTIRREHIEKKSHLWVSVVLSILVLIAVIFMWPQPKTNQTQVQKNKKSLMASNMKSMTASSKNKLKMAKVVDVQPKSDLSKTPLRAKVTPIVTTTKAIKSPTPVPEVLSTKGSERASIKHLLPHERKDLEILEKNQTVSTVKSAPPSKKNQVTAKKSIKTVKELPKKRVRKSKNKRNSKKMPRIKRSPKPKDQVLVRGWIKPQRLEYEVGSSVTLRWKAKHNKVDKRDEVVITLPPFISWLNKAKGKLKFKKKGEGKIKVCYRRVYCDFIRLKVVPEESEQVFFD